ncbi:MAG: tRNA (guanosine(37)-N1)-methyltransferase TrmD [Nitrospira sp.]|nr:tRNA (guanosine(37)-N1)-methyltransferase TrmD [bacterium]MBL7049966.1 tRNA (guanosine(37)-N1)-methyltransferase TrmD [Nitrospira sp.]
MKCDVLTLFPDILSAYLNESILKRARSKGLLDVALYNFRDFTSDSHRTVDDMPYGGGAGMVLKPEPLFKALDVLAEDGVPRRVVLLSPQGAPFSQKVAEVFSKEDRRIVFICGRYEGIDERVMSRVDEEISIGDYVMTGGELAALVIIDAVTRLLPGALGDAKSIEDESFTWGLLDYPQYTRPREYCGLKVPDVLLSGNHKDIIAWRRGQALKKTLAVRPDLLETAKLSDEDQRMISDLRDGYGSK